MFDKGPCTREEIASYVFYYGPEVAQYKRQLLMTLVLNIVITDMPFTAIKARSLRVTAVLGRGKAVAEVSGFWGSGSGPVSPMS